MTYKYFTEKETKGLQEEFIRGLDLARGYSKTPYIITSGYRSPGVNRRVGGVKDSSHVTGLAVDLKVKNSRTGYKIMYGLMRVGFTRIGFYSRHIHVDEDQTKPQNVMWLGDSK